jgi:ATP-binding cassette, subfamily F, member 3
LFKGVTGKPFFLKRINLNVDLESRMCLVGENGCGKSTMLKMLVGDHEACGGIVRRHQRLRVGYFTQHHVDTLDMTATSIQNLMERYPEANNLGEEHSRNWLGRFGVTQTMAVEPL